MGSVVCACFSSLLHLTIRVEREEKSVWCCSSRLLEIIVMWSRADDTDTPLLKGSREKM